MRGRWWLVGNNDGIQAGIPRTANSSPLTEKIRPAKIFAERIFSGRPYHRLVLEVRQRSHVQRIFVSEQETTLSE